MAPLYGFEANENEHLKLPLLRICCKFGMKKKTNFCYKTCIDWENLVFKLLNNFCVNVHKREVWQTFIQFSTHVPMWSQLW